MATVAGDLGFLLDAQAARQQTSTVTGVSVPDGASLAEAERIDSLKSPEQERFN